MSSNNEIHKRLLDIEQAYYDGAKFDALFKKIGEAAELICARGEHDPDREVCEVYAPLLWGEPSGSTISRAAVDAALQGENGGAHLRSWSGMGRVLVAYRVAA